LHGAQVTFVDTAFVAIDPRATSAVAAYRFLAHAFSSFTTVRCSARGSFANATITPAISSVSAYSAARGIPSTSASSLAVRNRIR
jgi:hypothetical protein